MQWEGLLPLTCLRSKKRAIYVTNANTYSAQCRADFTSPLCHRAPADWADGSSRPSCRCSRPRVASFIAGVVDGVDDKQAGDMDQAEEADIEDAEGARVAPRDAHLLNLFF